jgi:hypothetical protein
MEAGDQIEPMVSHVWGLGFVVDPVRTVQGRREGIDNVDDHLPALGFGLGFGLVLYLSKIVMFVDVRRSRHGKHESEY